MMAAPLDIGALLHSHPLEEAADQIQEVDTVGNLDFRSMIVVVYTRRV